MRARRSANPLEEAFLELARGLARATMALQPPARSAAAPSDPWISNLSAIERAIRAAAERAPETLDPDLLRRVVFDTLRHARAQDSRGGRRGRLVARSHCPAGTRIELATCVLGAGRGVLIAGPCAVETPEQIEEAAAACQRLAIPLMRGGAYKPRTSPYAFQGLGQAGLKILREAADRHDLAIVTEVLDPRDVASVGELADVLQIGSRNMQNFALLREVGRSRRAVLLKRGFGATLEEFRNAAEYILAEGNESVILCERGLRSFEPSTRATLDLASVALLKQDTHLPVIVDVSHSTGRRDIVLAVARGALAAGADGIMVEAHPTPDAALSDHAQQIDLDHLEELARSLEPWLRPPAEPSR